MAIDFDAELGKLHDAVDDVFGKPAFFRPLAAAPVACRAELDRPDALAQFGQAKLVTSDWTLRAQIVRLGRMPRNGDLFDIGEAPNIITVRVENVRPKSDPDAKIVECDVVQASQ